MVFEDFFRVTPKSRKIKLKHKKGILFSNPGLLMKTVFHIGNWLLLIAISYTVYLYFPIGQAVFNYWLSQWTAKPTTITQIPIIPTPTPVAVVEQQNEYTITIPKILAFSNIVDNVSPFNREEYLKVLESDVVAQAKDTAKPGSGLGKMTYLFAHSTTESLNMLRKNAVFYLLGELNNNDVIFIDKNGKNYTYRVYRQLVVEANQIQYLNYSDPKKELLILQTCWPIGTNWKRLLIFAERV
jgi:LPXTG-site transpeptidase (sortase) family protein